MADEETAEQSMHWADQMARKVIEVWGDKPSYTCASGITPSGVVHIGNFREIITTDLVVRALRDLGKSVRFIYSWDDFDVLRKVPADMPQQDMLKQHLRQPIIDIPDPFGTDASYAQHHEKRVESILPVVGIAPEFLYQSKKYRDGTYAKGIRKALEHTATIKAILDAYRTKPLEDDWLPVSVYDPQTNTDIYSELSWDGDDTLTFINGAGQRIAVRISEGKYVKLPWRMDWPMRWKHEDVEFEPGGKDHSSEGGSFTTAVQIADKVYSKKAPLYIMYDFINIKGAKGKMSSSKGGAVELQDVLAVYEPTMVRWLFAGTRPNTEFSISFDADVIKIYEDFDRCERIAFGLEDVGDKERAKQKRIYELSCVDAPPSTLPQRVGFRQMTMLVQVYQYDVERTLAYLKTQGMKQSDLEFARSRAECAVAWLKLHAPEEFVFKVRNTVDPSDPAIAALFTPDVRTVVEKLISLMDTSKDPDTVGKDIYLFCKENKYPAGEFYTAMYQLLLGKDKGPKLLPFIYAIGTDKVASMLRTVLLR